nr:hypothetical protein [Tanacetum cinerariifolium]
RRSKPNLHFLWLALQVLRLLNLFNLKNKGHVAETFDWDEEDVFDDEELVQFKVLMALADDELVVGKNHARNDK